MGSHYSCEAETHRLEAFIRYDSEFELLMAIAEWVKEIDFENTSNTLSMIEFNYGGSGKGPFAEVYWSEA